MRIVCAYGGWAQRGFVTHDIPDALTYWRNVRLSASLERVGNPRSPRVCSTLVGEKNSVQCSVKQRTAENAQSERGPHHLF